LIPADANLVESNNTFLAKQPKSIPHIISHARALHELEPKSEDPAKELLGIIDLPDTSISTAREVQDLLASWKSTEAETFTKKATQRWPRATVFDDRLSNVLAGLAI
jgi:hypothetical protein